MRALLEQTIRHLNAGERVVWCVILSAEGSTPRGPGAKMAVFEDGSSIGTVGGGAVEFQATALARTLNEKALIRSFDLYSGGSEATGMVCGGMITLCFLPFSPLSKGSLEACLAALDRPEFCWLLFRICADGSFEISLLPEPDLHAETSHPPMQPKLETMTDGTVIFTEPLTRGEHVYIFGAGHVSAALVPVLLPLGFPVTVIDPRPELVTQARFPGAELLCAAFDPIPGPINITSRDYIVVMSPAHTHDLTVLRQVLRNPASYIGCIGSKKKTAYVNQSLREEGFTEAELQRVHAPIGLPIKARTPEEIAVSIAAELILHRAEH